MRDLDQVHYICFIVLFWKYIEIREIITLIDFESKVNVMNLAYAAKLGFQIQKIVVCAQKIDAFFLKIYIIVIAIF